jgi:hypothetical protein
MSKGFGNMMRQAQNMKKKMEEIQEEHAKKTVDAEAGQGSVKVAVSGTGKLKKITIDPSMADPDDIETLEDLIVVAVNEATTKAKEERDSEMDKLTGGLNIPGMF